MLGIAVVGVVCVAHVNTLRFRSDILDQVREQLLVQAQAEASHVEKTLSDVERSLQLLASNPEIQHRCSVRWADLYAPVPEDRLESMFFQRLDYAISNLSCLDRDGKVLAQFPWQLGRVGRDYSQREDVKYVLKTSQPHLQSVFCDETGQDCVSYCYPVSHQKQLVGILRAVIPTQVIQDCLNESRVTDHRHVWMIDDQGIFVSHPQPHWVGQPLSGSTNDQRGPQELGGDDLEGLWSVDHGTGVATLRSFDESEQIVAWQSLVASGKIWTVCASVSLREVLLPVGRHIRNVSLTALALLILVAGIGVKVIRIQHEQQHLTERAAMVDQLEQARDETLMKNNMLEAMLGAMECSVTIRDLDYRLTYQNATCMEMYGNCMGQYCYSALPKCPEICPDCPVALAYEDGQTHVLVKECEDLKGRKLVLENTANPIRDKRGNIVACLEISRDITARVKLDQERLELLNQLRQKQKMEALGTLAGGIAHDFNNILMAIEGYTEFVQSELNPQSDAYQDIQQVRIAGKRGQDLVKQILAFSRKTDIATAPIQAVPIIQEALEIWRASIPKGVEFIEDIDADAHWIYGNETYLHQIVLNLCTNALQALGSEEGRIEVSLQSVTLEDEIELGTKPLPSGQYLKLMVQDTGCGMDSEVLARVFDPFFTTKDVDKGTGLGLAVVHGIVESCQGGIQVTSTVGQGTCVAVWFPMIDVTQKIQRREMTV